MGLGDGIRELVADVGVQTADINSGAVTDAKLSSAVAHFYRGTLAGQASGYVTLKTVTSACTLFFCRVHATAAGTSGTVTICNSAGSGIMAAINCSAAAAMYYIPTALLNIAAGGSICALYTTADTTGFAGNYVIGVIGT